MTSDRIYTDYLSDLLSALKKANHFVENMDFDEFTEDEKNLICRDSSTGNSWRSC
jgi:uncharacterized protein with HEPN domain